MEGTGFLGLLALLLIALKLCGVIDWSWLIVTMPLWGGLVVSLVVLAILCIIAAIFSGK